MNVQKSERWYHPARAHHILVPLISGHNICSLFLDRLKYESKKSKSNHSSSMESSTGRYHSSSFLCQAVCSLNSTVFVCVCLGIHLDYCWLNCLNVTLWIDVQLMRGSAQWCCVCVQESSARQLQWRPSQTTPCSETNWSTWASVSLLSTSNAHDTSNVFPLHLLKELAYERSRLVQVTRWSSARY